MTLSDLGALTTSDVFITGLPGLYYRLIKTDGSSRTLANPHLRTADGLPSSARFGEDVPVPTVTFAPIASGGVNQQPITAFTYRTIGVNIEITPRLHHDDDISLRLKLEVSNLSGVGYQNLPTFGTRYIETTIRLRDGETNMLAGLIRDDEPDALKGSPAQRPPDHRPPVRPHEEDQADRHRADADAADRPRARPRRRRPAPVRVGRDSSGGVYELPLPAQRPQPGFALQDDDAAPGASSAGSTPVGPRADPAADQPAATHSPAMPPTSPPRRVRRSRHLARLAENHFHGSARRLEALDHVRGRARPSRAARACSALGRQGAAWGPCPSAGRGCRGRGRAAFGPDTTMRCGSQRNRSARIPDSCSTRTGAARTSVVDRRRRRLRVAVTRLTMSLGSRA
jgi:hypothetical protein